MNAIDMVPPGHVRMTDHLLTTAQRIQGQQQKALSTSPDDPEKIRRTCQDMESLFLKQLLQEMRKTVPDNGSAGSGGQKKMFSELIDTEFSRKLAEKGFGLAGILEAQLMQRIEVETPAETGEQ